MRPDEARQYAVVSIFLFFWMFFLTHNKSFYIINMFSMLISNASRICGSGEDLVSKQTCQREEDKQEEVAAFPAGLYYHAYPTRAGRTY